MNAYATEFHNKGYGQLAAYNAEVARGIVHTDEWKAKMAELQRRFDEEHRHDEAPFAARFSARRL
jgi:hypothetical protein